MKIHTLDTGLFKLDGGAMFGVVPKTIWSKLNPADANNMCTWAMRCLLVETGNRLVLIDTGIGDKQSEKFFSFYDLHGSGSLLGSLSALGFSPDDITDVLLTHLHFDHCGGAIRRSPGHTDRFEPVFKNAVYWSNARHWQWAVKPNAREKASFLAENIMPIEATGQLKFLEDGESLLPGLSVWAVNGHTEGMLLPFMETSAGKFLFAADLIPSAAHIPVAYVMGYDTRPLVTLEEKQLILDRCAAENIHLVFEHDPTLQWAKVSLQERGIRLSESGNDFPFFIS